MAQVLQLRSVRGCVEPLLPVDEPFDDELSVFIELVPVPDAFEPVLFELFELFEPFDMLPELFDMPPEPVALFEPLELLEEPVPLEPLDPLPMADVPVLPAALPLVCAIAAPPAMPIATRATALSLRMAFIYFLLG